MWVCWLSLGEVGEVERARWALLLQALLRAYTHMRLHTHAHTHTYTHAHTPNHSRPLACTYARTHAHAHAHAHAYANTNAPTHTCPCQQKHVHAASQDEPIRHSPQKGSRTQRGWASSPPWPQPPQPPPQDGQAKAPLPTTVRAVCMGLHALCALWPSLDPPTQHGMRTLLESLARQASAAPPTGQASVPPSSAHVAPPEVLLAFSRCCRVFGCTLQPGMAEAVLQRAAAAAQLRPPVPTPPPRVQPQEQHALAATAGLLLPALEGGGQQQQEEWLRLVRTLLQRLTAQQRDTQLDQGSAAAAFYTAALAAGCSWRPLLDAMASAAQEARCPLLLALALRALAAAGCGAPECQVC